MMNEEAKQKLVSLLADCAPTPFLGGKWEAVFELHDGQEGAETQIKRISWILKSSTGSSLLGTIHVYDDEDQTVPVIYWAERFLLSVVRDDPLAQTMFADRLRKVLK